jgi:hypothetical protein
MVTLYFQENSTGNNPPDGTIVKFFNISDDPNSATPIDTQTTVGGIVSSSSLNIGTEYKIVFGNYPGYANSHYFYLIWHILTITYTSDAFIGSGGQGGSPTGGIIGTTLSAAITSPPLDYSTTVTINTVDALNWVQQDSCILVSSPNINAVFQVVLVSGPKSFVCQGVDYSLNGYASSSPGTVFPIGSGVTVGAPIVTKQSLGLPNWAIAPPAATISSLTSSGTNGTKLDQINYTLPANVTTNTAHYFLLFHANGTITTASYKGASPYKVNLSDATIVAVMFVTGSYQLSPNFQYGIKIRVDATLGLQWV